MAKIEKMLISGIRSYPPDGNSVIEFQSPLTLIVGANGTGKTVSIQQLLAQYFSVVITYVSLTHM